MSWAWHTKAGFYWGSCLALLTFCCCCYVYIPPNTDTGHRTCRGMPLCEQTRSGVYYRREWSTPGNSATVPAYFQVQQYQFISKCNSTILIPSATVPVYFQVQQYQFNSKYNSTSLFPSATVQYEFISKCNSASLFSRLWDEVDVAIVLPILIQNCGNEQECRSTSITINQEIYRLSV